VAGGAEEDRERVRREQEKVKQTRREMYREKLRKEAEEERRLAFRQQELEQKRRRRKELGLDGRPVDPTPNLNPW